MPYIFVLFLPLFLNAASFKVASYNVENLFDARYDGTEYEEYIPGKHNWNRRMVEIKLNHIAEVICDLDADILALQEIENSHIFHRLKERLKEVGCGYRYAAITSKKSAPIQVALLSRYAIVKERQIEVSDAPRVRRILEVTVDVEGHHLILFVNHWKSKSYKGYESKRIAYAKRLQARIARLHPSQEYIVLGDFNSDYNAYLTLEDKINDTNGKTAFNDVLQTKIGAKLVDEQMIQHARGGVHFSLWHELDVEDRWSHKFYGKYNSIDHIVLPRVMFDGRGIDYVNNSFGVFKREYLFTKRGYINRWRYKKGKHRAKGYSDHLPVYAYFSTKPYIKERQQSWEQKSVHIASLYEMESLKGPVVLEDVVVIMKRGRHAIIKQTPEGRGVMLFGCAGGLEEGRRYDLLVEAIKSYKGLKEITHAYKLNQKGSVDLSPYYKDVHALLHHRLLQNEVLRDIVATYRNKEIHLGGKSFPVYFKKQKLTPKNGTKIKIDYAHLGYYKKLQLVVYSKKDFTILE